MRRLTKLLNMELSARRFNEKDHSILAQWWTDWNFPVVPLHLLPAFGVIVSSGKNDVCAGFCYRTDSSYALTEYVVCSKNFRDKKIKEVAFEKLFDDLGAYAKAFGHGVLLTYVNSKEKSFLKRLQNNKYVVGDNDMIGLIKII